MPDPANDRRYYFERLGPHTVINCSLFGEDLTILSEPEREGSTFGCSYYDVFLILSRLPETDVQGLKLVVFRQPTRKQEILRPVWGRCVYDADFGSHTGPAIIIDAIDLKRPIRWPNKLSIEDRAELDRLAEDGHVLERGRRHTLLRPSVTSVRNTILYRTLLHEVGHWQEWRKSVLEPARRSGKKIQDDLAKLYFSRGEIAREQVADRYAATQKERLLAEGVIPFDPI